MSPRPSSKIALRNREIVHRRMNGERPEAIAVAIGNPEFRVRNIINRAKQNGVVFPDIQPRRRRSFAPGEGCHRHIPNTTGSDSYREPPPKRALPFETLTVEEEIRLRELASRNLGLTGIAAILRRQYRTVDAALVRLGLSRAGAST